MEAAIFTLSDIQQLYGEAVAPALTNPAGIPQAFSLFITTAYGRYEEMTPEAASFLHEREKAFVAMMAHLNEKLPDSADKRKMKRLLSDATDKHVQATRLITNFPVLRNTDELVDQGHNLFTRALQRLLDFMHDITANIHRGVADFARINLLYWAVDELTAANFLTRRGYTTLAYPHLRCVIEIVDKVELFGKQPEMAEIWASGDEEHEIWKKLSPPRVRVLLGRDNKDPIYAHFSAQGAHPTFTATRTRTTKKDHVAGVLNVGIGVGGKRNQAEQVALMHYCIMLANLCTMHATLAFPDELNVDEATTAAATATIEQLSFLESLAKVFPDVDAHDGSSIGILVNSWRSMQP